MSAPLAANPTAGTSGTGFQGIAKRAAGGSPPDRRVRRDRPLRPDRRERRRRQPRLRLAPSRRPLPLRVLADPDPALRSGLEWLLELAQHGCLAAGCGDPPDPGRQPGARLRRHDRAAARVNPELKVLAYDLGPYTVAGTSDYTTLMSEHPDYFARDAQGNLITVAAGNGSPAYPDNTLMDDGNPGWQAFEAQRVASEISTWGFDGAYIDSMGPGVVTGSTTGVPIDPSTGQAYTQAEWMAAGTRPSTPSRPPSAPSTSSPPSRQRCRLRGLHVRSVRFDGERLPDRLLDAARRRLADGVAEPLPARLGSRHGAVAAGRGKAFFAWTKVWTSATPAQVSAWNTYGLAAYLLVDNGVNDYYTFDSPFASDRTTIFYPNERSRWALRTGASPEWRRLQPKLPVRLRDPQHHDQRCNHRRHALSLDSRLTPKNRGGARC